MKVLIADDHELYRDALARAVHGLDEDVEVFLAKDWSAAVSAASANRFDLVLVDLFMPGMEPFAGLSALLERCSLSPLVVISSSENLHDMRRALSAGAMGYIAKSEPTTIMLGALSLVLCGGVYLPPSLLDAPSAASHLVPAMEALTPQQRKVFQAVSRGLSNKEIALEMGLSVPTVKSHVSALFRTLKISKRYEAIRLADEAGIKF